MSYKIIAKKPNRFFNIVFILLIACSHKVVAQINFICPESDCSNGIDDDGDGYVDCYDLDCVLSEPRPAKSEEQKSIDCYNLSEECVNYLLAFIADTANNQWIHENENMEDVWGWGLSFMAQYGCTEEIGSFVRDAFILKKMDEEINLDRIEDLYLALLADPNALLVDCPDFDLQTYSDLLNLQVPISIINQLASYGNCVDPPGSPNNPPAVQPCFSIQTFEQGTSALANTDYYAVEITQFPDFDSNGIPDTKEQIYQEFRDHFTELVSGMTTITNPTCPNPTLNPVHASWTFMPYDINVDLPLWESSMIGARFFIDADAEEFAAMLIADDGAIITIQENQFTFIVATITTPQSGSQPFAGKRMWGIRTNESGNCEIFTRAIDRAKPIALLSLIALAPWWNECADADYFDIAKRTWSNFQVQVAQFLSTGGGVGSIKTPKVVPLNLKQVYEKLKSNVPVNFVSCQ